MTHSPNLFPLKLVVISLGFILLAGIVFILVTIAARAKEEMHTHCPDAVLHIGTGELVSVVPQGKLVQVTVREGPQTKVLTAERCSGNILQTVTIAP